MKNKDACGEPGVITFRDWGSMSVAGETKQRRLGEAKRVCVLCCVV